MTVETTIQQMFDEYPYLFSTRQECYDHLFCCIGNGCEWKRGQIVPIVNDEEDQNMQMREEMDYANLQDAWESARLKPKAVQSETNIAKRRKKDEELYDLLHSLEHEIDLEDGLEDDLEDDLEDGLSDIEPHDPNRRYWYPISEHSLINNVPKDVNSSAGDSGSLRQGSNP